MPTTKIRGIKIEFAADTNKLVESLNEVKKSLKSTETSLRDVDRLLKFDTNNPTLLAQKQDYLTEAIKKTRDQLEKQQELYASLKGSETGELTEEQKALTREIESTRQKLNKYESQLTDVKGEIDGTSKNTKELAKNTEDTAKAAKKGAEGWAIWKQALATALSQKIVSGLNKLKAATIGVAKEAVNLYGDYEQLVGGIETLYKEQEVINKVMANAKKAYETTGQSANEYMENVTGFTASLRQSLGSLDEVADVADMAMQDMADNANKMGTAMDSITNAYQGFAKQNYTMLDNLKLGYGGTKTEMERLLKDAQKLTGVKYDIGNLADVYRAIHAIQSELGITGTTAKEASETLQGSAKAMKSAWANALIALADETQNSDKAFNTFAKSLRTYIKNLVPRVEEVIRSIAKSLDRFVPNISKTLLPLFDTIKSIGQYIILNSGAIIAAITGIGVALASIKISGLIGNATTALAGLSSTISTLTASGTTLMGALTSLSNPIGTVVAGIGLIAGAITLFSSSTKKMSQEEYEVQKRIQETANVLDEQKESWKALEEARQQSLNSGMSEISYTESLWKELQKITDSNGKIQEGYEARASFITGKLSEAIGTEITITNGIVQSYQKLGSTIDDVIEKKKAQIILDSQETKYAEAINNQAEAVKNLARIEGLLNDSEEEYAKLREEREQLVEKLNSNEWESHSTLLQNQLSNIDQLLNKKAKETSELQRQYDEQADIVDEYYYNIQQYESNAAKFHEGNYAEMQTTTWAYTREFESAEKSQLEALQQSVREQEIQLERWEKVYQETGDEALRSRIETNKAILDDTKSQLKQLEESTKASLERTTANFTSSGTKQATDYLAGLRNGLNNSNIRSSIYSSITTLGNNMLSRMKASLQERSPSKATAEMGEFLIEGLSKGIKDEQTSLFSQISTFGANTLSAFNNSLDSGIISNLNGETVANGLGAGAMPAINITVNEAENAQATADLVMQQLQFAVASNGRTWQ